MNVLENILKQIDELKENYWCDSKERKDGAMDMSNIIKDIIKQHLQSGEDNNVLADDWVPCSVRMPADPGDYRVTVFEKWHDGKEELHTDFASFPGEYIDQFDTFNDWDEGQEVHIIAWKKINDDPYKPDPESADGKRQREREEFFTEYKEQSDQTELNGFLKKRFMEVV